MLKSDDATCGLGVWWAWELAASEKWSLVLKTRQTGCIDLGETVAAVCAAVCVSELSLMPPMVPETLS